MRPVRGVHDPQREVMTRSVICVGCRPITGPPLGQQLWQRGVDRGRRLSFAFVGPDLGAVKIRLDIRTGLAWPSVTNSRTTDITGFRTTGNASIMAAGTSYATTSVLEAGTLVQCHDGAPLRLSHALLLGKNPRMSLFDEIRDTTLAHPHRCGDFDAAARRFDAQIQVFDGFARQVQMDAINIQRLLGGSGPNGFRRTGLRSGGLTTAIRHASHSRTTADNKRHTMPPLTNRQPPLTRIPFLECVYTSWVFGCVLDISVQGGRCNRSITV